MSTSDKIVIIQDSREQVPFRFSDDVVVECAALPVGDYSVKGFEADIVVERKSLSDFLSSITHQRERFERELRQFRGFRAAFLMIETTWPDLMLGMFGPRQVSPNAALASLLAFTLRYGVTPILCGDHQTGAELTERIFTLFAKMVRRDYEHLTSPTTALP